MSRLITLLLVAGAFVAGGAVVWVIQTGGGSEGVHEDQAAAEEQRAGTETTWYTCGMDPEVVQDHPGDCPKCGMKLQPMSPDRAAAMGLATPEVGAPSKAAGDRKVAYWKSPMVPGEIHSERGQDSMGHDLVPVYEDEVAMAGTIQIDPVTEQNMGVRVATVTKGPLRKTVRTVAFVDYDETTLTTVTTKVNGWVEKLHVDQTGAQVHRGEPLFELYSPQLFSAQQEYLAAIRNRQRRDVPAVPDALLDSQALVRDARTRLEYFDISAEQIAEIEKTGRARKTLTIHAPFTGIVTQKHVVAGQMIKAGEEVFRIADLSTVWVMGKVFERDLPHVRLSQEGFMTLSYLPGKTFRGRVTYVYPYLEAKTREIPIRMEFHNPGYALKPGMYGTVTLGSEVAAEATLVPDLAVIDTGQRSIVFTMPQAGRYEPREVTLGLRSDNNYVQVLSGLAPGDRVVVSGQFLLDSESRLREAALKFLKPGQVDGTTPIQTATERAQAERPATDPTPAADAPQLSYVCPMPEHVDILYDAPGSCPLCGMKLVPVERRAGHMEEPRISHWTCPMPEHASVRESGPGKCPICAMTLIPATEPAPQAGSGEAESPSVSHWTCPMPEHASVRESGPGKCPICGMALVPATEPAPEGATAEPAAPHVH